MNSGLPKKNNRKKKLGSYPYVSVLFSITLALFVIGVFGTLLIYSRELEKIVRNNIQVQVYLKNHLTEADKIEIKKKIATSYFLPKLEKEKAIQFYSKEAAAKQFIKEMGEDFQKFLGENPLRDAYLVKVDPIFHDKQSMAKLKASLEKINGVYEASYVESLIQSVNENVTKIALVLAGIMSILLLVVVLLINNTLRLALFSQRFLIRSMQLVGAKKWFIQKPFIVRATLHGLISGLLASALLITLIYLANQRIEDLKLLQQNNSVFILLASLLVLGILIAVLSTFRAVRKYLKLSLDELY